MLIQLMVRAHMAARWSLVVPRKFASSGRLARSGRSPCLANLPAMLDLLDLAARHATKICLVCYLAVCHALQIWLLCSTCSIWSLAIPRKFAWHARLARSGHSPCMTNLLGALDLLDLVARLAPQICLVCSICLIWLPILPLKFAWRARFA